MNNLNPNISEIMQSDKSQLESLAYKFFEEVESGNAEPLQALIAMRKCKEVFEKAESLIKPIVESQCMPSKGVATTLYNAKCEQAEAGVKYDYSECGDLVYSEILAKETDISAKKKERETFLKSCSIGQGVVTSDGESYAVNPPIKTSKTIIKITLL